MAKPAGIGTQIVQWSGNVREKMDLGLLYNAIAKKTLTNSGK